MVNNQVSMGFFDLFRSRRHEKISQVAREMGFHYDAMEDFGLTHLLADFQLMKIGGSRKVRNLMWQDDSRRDVRARIFDYQYTIHAGNTHHVHRQSVFFIHSQSLGLPLFCLKPEHLMHKVSAWLGMNDIDFDHHPEFSRLYHLKGEDEYLIRETFSDPVLDYFAHEKGWHIEGINYFLIVYRAKNLLPPDKIPEFYQKGLEIYELFRGKGFSV